MTELDAIDFRNTMLSLVSEICTFHEDRTLVLSDLDDICAVANELRAKVEHVDEPVADERDAGWVGAYNGSDR